MKTCQDSSHQSFLQFLKSAFRGDKIGGKLKKCFVIVIFLGKGVALIVRTKHRRNAKSRVHTALVIALYLSQCNKVPALVNVPGFDSKALSSLLLMLWLLDCLYGTDK